MKSVLFLGSRSGTSGHRIDALRRLGCTVLVLDPAELAPQFHWASIIEWKVAPEWLARAVTKRVLHATVGQNFDLVFVDSGSLVSRELLIALKRQARWSVNFNHDDPYGPRDWTRFRAYRSAVSAYDLVIVVREPNIEEAKACGARNVMHCIRTADIYAHARLNMNPTDVARWATDVLFVGTWMRDRDTFLLSLANQGISPSIYGDSWQKAPKWNALKPYWRGPGLHGDDYRYAIQAAKICLGFLSKDNRDRHTTRSLEIPRMGGLFCAERTEEHLALYVDQQEAVFWDDVQECGHLCNELLQDEPRRQQIASAGHRRALLDNHTNDALMQSIFERLQSSTTG